VEFLQGLEDKKEAFLHPKPGEFKQWEAQQDKIRQKREIDTLRKKMDEMMSEKKSGGLVGNRDDPKMKSDSRKITAQLGFIDHMSFLQKEVHQKSGETQAIQEIDDEEEKEEIPSEEPSPKSNASSEIKPGEIFLQSVRRKQTVGKGWTILRNMLHTRQLHKMIKSQFGVRRGCASYKQVPRLTLEDVDAANIYLRCGKSSTIKALDVWSTAYSWLRMKEDMPTLKKRPTSELLTRFDPTIRELYKSWEENPQVFTESSVAELMVDPVIDRICDVLIDDMIDHYLEMNKPLDKAKANKSSTVRWKKEEDAGAKFEKSKEHMEKLLPIEEIRYPGCGNVTKSKNSQNRPSSADIWHHGAVYSCKDRKTRLEQTYIQTQGMRPRSRERTLPPRPYTTPETTRPPRNENGPKMEVDSEGFSVFPYSLARHRCLLNMYGEQYIRPIEIISKGLSY